MCLRVGCQRVVLFRVQLLHARPFLGKRLTNGDKVNDQICHTSNHSTDLLCRFPLDIYRRHGFVHYANLNRSYDIV
jgi:hypothetical protein